MAVLTGYNQAVVLYKVAEATGEALDIDGKPVTISGRKQAIALLDGFHNPDPDLYEVEIVFQGGDRVEGVPTIENDPDKCNPGELVPWILDTGFWDNSAKWTPDGIWNY